MASIRREITIHAQPDRVWDALRDVGALHTRLAKGFVRDTKLDGETRTVTFANGNVVHERIVDVDDERRRVAWNVTDAPFVHHNASAEIIATGNDSCRFVWTADLLPHALAPTVAGLIETGLSSIKKTLEATESSPEARS